MIVCQGNDERRKMFYVSERGREQAGKWDRFHGKMISLSEHLIEGKPIGFPDLRP